MGSIFEGLNSEQSRAVDCTEGPVLIVAGAGSGKTRVLTCRVANILEKGCEAERVLALTFTKKAAGEMKERIAVMVGQGRARRLCMGTFHSVFIRFLRDYSDRLGYPSSFTIYDTSDSISAIKACLKELELDDKTYKPKDVLGRISKAKNNLVTPEAYRNNPNIITSDTHSKKPRICDIYSLYAKKCKQAGVMDFDDILLNMNILLRDCPEALKEISSRFSYILVDEYQDTNYAQYLILKKLAQIHHNICVVGDDSQSIYAFRGAKIENILNFRKDYPECKIFRLERNYRSTRTIVDAANSVIAKNNGRIPKQCYSEGEVGEKIKLISAYTESEESLLIVSDILDRIRTDKAEYKDFAVLYRTNSQSRALEEALRRRNIPYMIYSGNSFFDRAEVKDMMAYFKLVVNVMDDESFKRVINRPARGIGDTSLNALVSAAQAHGTSLFKAAFAEDLENFGLRNAAILKIRDFCRMIDGFASVEHTSGAHELALKIADASGLYAFFKADTSIEGLTRTSNVEELLNSVASYEEDTRAEVLADMEAEAVDGKSLPEPPLIRLGDFLENVSLLSNADTSDGGEDSDNKVALMTVHSAKGLEFPYVFVAGMEENLFPSGTGGMSALPQEIEEERRLFYVAVTRACKSVVLSFAQTRMRNGKHEENDVSRFVKEIDNQYIANPLRSEFPISRKPSSEERSFFGGRGNNTARSATEPVLRTKAQVLTRPLPPKIPDAEFIPSPMNEFRTGQTVEHNRFGNGIVMEISGSYPELKARIRFDEYGEKVIMLKYAKLRILK